MRSRPSFAPWLVLCGAMSAACDGSAEQPHDAALSAADGALAAGAATDNDASKSTEAPTSYPDGGRKPSGATGAYGNVFSGGQFHLGPVDWDETQFHNACASDQKYQGVVRKAEGQLLAGIWSGVGMPESYCDACIEVHTAKGKSAVLRVVTYGDTTTNSVDVSSEAYALLDSGEIPRNMSWQLVECPDTGKLIYEFKTGSNAYWTAFWVRNARVPLASVEVMSLRHAYALTSRDSDGSLVDAVGFGEGMFSVRVTSADGQVVTDTFSQPTNGLSGALLGSRANFQ